MNPYALLRAFAPVTLVAALAASGCASALAQGDQLVAPREGNIYGHVKHQPTESEVGGAAGGDGVNAPSAGNQQQVEKGVQELLQQTDRLDKATDEELNAGSSSALPRTRGPGTK